MPIIDHVEKAVAPSSSGVLVPFAFAPEALNRNMLVMAMVNENVSPSSNPLPGTITYAGLALDSIRTAFSNDEPGSTRVYLGLYWRSMLLGDQPLSGDVVLDLAGGVSRNLIVYAIGLRGIAGFPFWEARESVNSGPSLPFALVASPNNFVGIFGFGIKSEGVVTSFSGAGVLVEQDVIADGTASLTGAICTLPKPSTLMAGSLNGNAAHGIIGFVPYADQPQGEAKHIVRVMSAVGPVRAEGAVGAPVLTEGGVGPASTSGAVVETSSITAAVLAGQDGVVGASIHLAGNLGVNRGFGLATERTDLTGAIASIGASGTVDAPALTGSTGIVRVSGVAMEQPG